LRDQFVTLLTTACPRCQAPTSDDAHFCTRCGLQLSWIQSRQEGQSRRRPWRTGAILLLVAILGIGGGLTLFFNARRSQFASETEGDSPISASGDTRDGNAPSVGVDLSPAELATNYGDAVFRVETLGCGLEGVGSAFAISDHQLITNWHVVVNDVTPILRSRDGIPITGRVIGWSEDPDIAVIETATELDVQVEWEDTSELAEGEQLASLGYPLPDHEFSVIPGSILSFVREGTRRMAVRTDANVDRGSSGGPALTPDGTVAGVVTQIDLNLDGFQYVPMIVTYDALADTVDDIVTSRQIPGADCAEAMRLADAQAFNSGSGAFDVSSWTHLESSESTTPFAGKE
jgi:S1-C subfamily serine protease